MIFVIVYIIGKFSLRSNKSVLRTSRIFGVLVFWCFGVLAFLVLLVVLVIVYMIGTFSVLVIVLYN